MSALAHVDLSADAQAISTSPVSVTSASLTQGRTYLVLGMGHARTTAGLGSYAYLDLSAGGTVYARIRSSSAFGTPSNGGLAGCQLGAAFLFTAGASDELQFDCVAEGVGEGESWRAYAVDVTDVDQRWSEEGANNDTVVTTPGAAAGWVTVGNALTFTAPVTGDYVIFASCEAVAAAGAAAAEEVRTRLQVDAVTVSGTTSECDMPTTPGTEGFVDGYMVCRVVNISAGSHTIRLQGEGTAGTVGYRRVRIHAILASEFEDVQQGLDTDGETATNTTPFQASGISLTLNPPVSRDYLMLSYGQRQQNFYDETHFYLAGTAERPVNGYSHGVNDLGIAAGDDMPLAFGLHLETGITSSTSLQYRMQRLGGASNNVYGATCARSSAGEIAVVAIRLSMPDTLSPSAVGATCTALAPSVALGAVIFAVSSQAATCTAPAPAIAAGEVSATPAAMAAFYDVPAPSVTVSAVTVQPAASGVTFGVPTPGVIALPEGRLGASMRVAPMFTVLVKEE